MALLKDFKTIPELFDFLVEDFGKNSGRFIIKRKKEGKYQGITYDEFGEETKLFALGLAALGINPGDKVAIISENRPEWVFSDVAILSLGGIDVPIYPSLTADSIEFILNNSESKGVIVSNKLQLNKILKIKKSLRYIDFIIVYNDKDMVEDVRNLHTFKDVQEMGKIFRKEHPNLYKDSIRKVKEDDLCTIIYTSGTTGEPKGVLLTHKNIISNVKGAHQSIPINQDDVFLSFLPLCHIFERMGGYYTAFASGGTICYAESIEMVSTNLLEVKPTIMTSVPRLFERIYSKVIRNIESQPPSKQKIFYWAVETGKKYHAARRLGRIPVSLTAKYRLADKLVFQKIRERTGGNLRFFISGGAALSRDLGEFFEAAGILILEGYGLTESSPVIALNTLESYKFGTVGKPFHGVELKIAPDGEILARGPNIMQGYYKNKRETDATLKNGWLHTGDIGVFDSDGFLMITDRKKHLFKTTAGKYIAPTPIENLFLSSKYIDQFILIGDRRMFLSALIVPDYEAVKEYADSQNIKYKSADELVKDKNIVALFDKEMGTLQKRLANYEKVRRFTLLNKPFTIETGEMTPSLKIKRKVVEERYKNMIDEMYDR